MKVRIAEHGTWEGYTIEEPAEGKAIFSGADWYEVPAELVMRWRTLMHDYAEVQEELARIVGGHA